MTRYWMDHGSMEVSVSECLRAMQSLMYMLEIMTPAVLPHTSDADAALDCIQSHFACVESALCAEVELSVELHACLVFMRALRQLRDGTRNCMSSRAHDGNIGVIIEQILRNHSKPQQQLACSMVLQGRHYMFHGTNMRLSLPLLQSACAVSLLLRSLGAPATVADNCNARAMADACDAQAMQLMVRMGISDATSCVAELVTSHSGM